MAENDNNQNNKLTVYQKLNKTLNLDGFGFDTTNLSNANPTFASHYDTQRAKIIIKGDSPQDIRMKGLELQQKQELTNKFFKSSERSFQKSMQYEAARLPAYIDYMGMEYYPLIASALDLYMEEATTIGMNGRMLNIYSNKERIKLHLEELFNDIININVNLPFWTRNLSKFGDNFVLLFGENKKGITNVQQMVNYEVERIDRVHNGKPNVKFKERITGNEFNIFEIAHFRLLGDDLFIPYGASCLSKVRRTWRQLVLAEDAMLTYRIIRAGEKKVFKIDVGNIDNDDVDEYIAKVASAFKKSPQVDNNNGQLDYRFNILGNDEDYFLPVRNGNSGTGIETLPGACLALDTKIELLDGRSLELSNIIDEYNNGKKLWSYSINPESGEIVPGIITWAGVTRKNTEVLKLTLDNGETITCTPDHKFLLREFKKIEAKDLKIGDSLMPFYKRMKKIYKKYEYEQIFDIFKNDWVTTHKMVSSFFKAKNVIKKFIFNSKIINRRDVIHHKNFNRFDNSPNNLVIMGDKDHISYHGSINSTINNWWNNNKISINVKESVKKHIGNILSTYNKKRWKNINYKSKMSKFRINLWKDDEYRKKTINKQKEYINSFGKYNYSIKLHKLLIESNLKSNNFNELLNNVNNNPSFIELYNEGRKNIYKYKYIPIIKRRGLDSIIKYFNYDGLNDLNNKSKLYNHKIVSIEYLNEKQDTGTITIDGNEKYHNFHNFALTCGVFTKNSNLNDINDIEYLRDNLFSGLSIPKPFLSMQDAAGAGKNMAQFDMRFAKKIARIQQAMIQELNKIAIIHLTYLGFDNEDLGDFTLTLNNPSTQQELLKTDLLNQKAQAYSNLTKVENGIAAMSHTEAKKMIFNMSDHEIINDLRQQRMERAIMQELQDTPLVIKHTTVFDDIDKKYGEAGGEMMGGTPEMSGDTETSMPSGGGLPTAPTETPQTPGAEFQKPNELPPVEGEGFKHRKSIMSEKTYNNILDKLVNNGKSNNIKQNIIVKNKEVLRENELRNKKLNEEASDMILEINKLLEDPDKSKELLKTYDKLTFDFDKIRINEIKDNDSNNEEK